MKDLRGQCIKAIRRAKLTPEECHDWLISEDMSESDAWLTYVGARMITKTDKGDES